MTTNGFLHQFFFLRRKNPSLEEKKTKLIEVKVYTNL